MENLASNWNYGFIMLLINLLTALFFSSGMAMQSPGTSAETHPLRPLMFEPNQGQAPSGADFLSHGRGYTFLLAPTEATMVLHTGAGNPSRRTELRNFLSGAAPASAPSHSTVLRMNLIGASAQAQLEPLSPLPTRLNYFIGNEPAYWHQNIPTFAKVAARNVYPGTDLIYYGAEGRLEFDFVLGPGADPSLIRLSLEGADGLQILNDGDLAVRAGGGELRYHKPLIYQQDGITRREVPGRFVLKGGTEFAFDISAYDHSKALTLDPILWYSTYLGGDIPPFTGAADVANGIAVTTNGTTYVVGTSDGVRFIFGGGTSSQRFFVSRTDTNIVLKENVFVAKYTATTNASQTPVLMNMTFLGGSGDDRGEAIAVDKQGGVYITGSTTSTNFPVVNAFQRAFAGARPPTDLVLVGASYPGDAFVAKLSIPDCCDVPFIGPPSYIVYSSYLGGASQESGFGIAVDATGNAYVTGMTYSTNFPTTSKAFQRVCKSCTGGFADAFVTKISPGGTAIVYSTFLGGDREDDAFAIAVNPATGVAYVTGITYSQDFPHPGITPSILPFQPSLNGPSDAFVSVVGATGTNLVWSTFLGGSWYDVGYGIAVSPPGFRTDVHVTGQTMSADFPAVAAFQPAISGIENAFVTKILSGGAGLAYSSYLGGGAEQANAIALDAANTAFITGETRSTNFPVKNAIQPVADRTPDAFVAQISILGSNLFSTYLGGKGEDSGQGIAIDGAGRAYIAGWTTFTNFPVLNAVQSFFNGGASDGFVAKLGALGHEVTMNELLAQVESLDLEEGLITSLRVLLEHAQQSFEAGRRQTALAQLAAFGAQVHALEKAGQLNESTASLLGSGAEALSSSP
jgi:Beta-propeller repeat